MLYLLLGDRYCFMRISFLLERRVSSSDAGFSFLDSCIKNDAPFETPTLSSTTRHIHCGVCTWVEPLA